MNWSFLLGDIVSKGQIIIVWLHFCSMIFWRCLQICRWLCNFKSSSYLFAKRVYHNSQALLLHIIKKNLLWVAFSSGYFLVFLKSEKERKTILRNYAAVWIVPSLSKNLQKVLLITQMSDVSFPKAGIDVLSLFRIWNIGDI